MAFILDTKTYTYCATKNRHASSYSIGYHDLIRLRGLLPTPDDRSSMSLHVGCAFLISTL